MLSWLPKNVSTYGGEIDSIIALIYYVTLAWFVVTLGGFLLFLLLYRRREGRRATYVTGERFQEVAWILILGIIVLGLDLWIDFRGADVWAEVKGRMPSTELTVPASLKCVSTIVPVQLGSILRAHTVGVLTKPVP